MSATEVSPHVTTSRHGRRWRHLAAGVCAVGLMLGGWSWWRYRSSRAAMDGIQASIVAGQYATACRDLATLLSRQADSNGEIAYLLGSCELARGRLQEAGQAWSRIVPGSRFSEKAIEGRMHILQETGHFTAAEKLIKSAASDSRNDRTGLLVLLVPLLGDQGRVDEAARIIEERWEQLNAQGKGGTRACDQTRLAARRFELFGPAN